MTWRRRSALASSTALSVLASVVWMTGCSGTATSSDPGTLELGKAETGWCLSRFKHPQDYTFGAETIENTGPHAAKVTAVKLLDAQGVRLVGSYATPIEEGSAGVLTGWEGPAAQPSQISVPATSERWLTLKLETMPDVDEASFDGVVVEYEQDGSQHTTQSKTEFQIAAKNCKT